jgi:hypothetical protein
VRRQPSLVGEQAADSSNEAQENNAYGDGPLRGRLRPKGDKQAEKKKYTPLSRHQVPGSTIHEAGRIRYGSALE